MKYFVLCLIVISCTGPKTWERLELLEMARKADPTLEVMVPASLGEPLVYCDYYKPPCYGGYKIKVKKIQMTVLEYKTPAEALKSAKAIDGYVARNWVFDDVKGEPILERFVIKHFDAKVARKIKAEK